MFKKHHSFSALLAHHRDLTRSILNNSWLTRVGSALLVGPSGCGKSRIKDWIVCAIACGREIFGMKPTQALKVLSIQAEDTDEDVAESYQGYAKHELSDDPETIALIDCNLVALTLIGLDGYEFIEEIDRLCEEHKPDLRNHRPNSVVHWMRCRRSKRGHQHFSESGCSRSSIMTIARSSRSTIRQKTQGARR